ncbi:Uncharacterised protein [Neisseria mucosa]|nr:hypothetical protein [Neisseria mucosa]SUA94168.1 Uncharacterised protein [Neisseria mucosa]
MQVLKKVDCKMFVARSFWRWVPVGLTVGVWCFVGGMALYGCTQEPEPIAKEPTKVQAMDRQADLEVLKMEYSYEAMSVEQKWKELYMNKFKRPKRGLNRIKKLALKRAVEEIRAKYGERAITKGWCEPEGK